MNIDYCWPCKHFRNKHTNSTDVFYCQLREKLHTDCKFKAVEPGHDLKVRHEHTRNPN